MDELLVLAAPTLRRQQALITRRQCLELGGSAAALRRLLDRGIWETVDRGLYGPSGVPLGWSRRLMAASLLAPPGSLVSHCAAGALLDVGGLTQPKPELSVHEGQTFRRPWVITHESKDLDLADVVVIDGIPTTGPRRLAMDIGSVVSFPRFKHTVREIRHQHGVTNEQLLHTYLRHKQRGRNGGGSLRDWLDRYFAISGTAESGLELVVLDAILDSSLPAPVAQHWVVTAGGRFRLDLAYPERKIAIEVDGVQHEDLDIVPADQRRTALLEDCGWTVIRVRSKHLATDLPRALRALESLLSENPVDR
jgi:hypothetical protein